MKVERSDYSVPRYGPFIFMFVAGSLLRQTRI